MKGKRWNLSVFMTAVCIWLFLCVPVVAAESFLGFPWFSVPSAPTLSVTVNGDQVTLIWDSVTGARGYRVYADPAMGQDFDGTFDLSWDFEKSTTFTATLWPGADFYCGVSAYNVLGESGSSNIVRVGFPPAAPTLTLTTGEDEAVLSWNGVAGAQGYRVYADHARGAPFDGTFDSSWDFQTTSGTVQLWSGADVYYAVTAYNASGESGFSNMVRLFPSPVDKDWVSIATGDDHSVALKADGSLWAWGRNQDGQLGDGTNVDRITPTQIGEDSDWVAIFAGGNQTFGIKANGTLWGWGSNSNGQLGDGTKENRSVPTQIGRDHDWGTLSTRLHNTVAVKTDGTLWAWGNMSAEAGFPGEGTAHLEADVVFPTRVGQGTGWVYVTAADFFAVALKSDHTMWRWGGHYLASGSEPEPVQIGDEADWRTVSAGERHVVALKIDGTLWTWGWSQYGALGNGVIGELTYVLHPQRITAESDWTFVHACAMQTFAIKSNGTLWAWGENSQGQLGDETVFDRAVPTPAGLDYRWRAVAAGYNHTVGLRSDGTVWAWGRGEYGERGDGIESTDQDGPVRIEPRTEWRYAAGGAPGGLAIDRDCALWTWGSPIAPILKSGNTLGLLIQVGSDLDWAMASGGAYHMVSTKINGTLWAFGQNYTGQLGDGSYETQHQPIRIGSDSDWKSVDAGREHNVAVKTDGTLWAWGRNDYGQLGDGTTETRPIPVQIGGDTDWVVAVTRSHTVGLKADGTLWSWGYNGTGQLGDGTTEDRHYPVQVGTDSDWKMIAAGDSHTVAIKEDHSLWAWGWNSEGQLGDATTINRLTPVQVGESKDWRAISASHSFTVGIKLDGTLWLWGFFWFGKPGGRVLHELRPVQMGTDTDWDSVSAGTHHVLALKRDGSLWAFGQHGYAKIEPVNIVLGADQQ